MDTKVSDQMKGHNFADVYHSEVEPLDKTASAKAEQYLATKKDWMNGLFQQNKADSAKV